MEMEVYTAEVAESFGQCLTEFLETDMAGKKKEKKIETKPSIKPRLGPTPTVNVKLQGIKKLKGVTVDVAIFECTKRNC